MNEPDPFTGFDSPNYTQAPNQFFDDLLKQIDDLSELKVTLCAIRQTFGFHRTQAEMSLTFFEKVTGLSRNSVRRGIDLAVARGLLIEVTPATRQSSAVYQVPVNYRAAAETQPLTHGGAAAATGVVQPLLQGGAAAETQPLTPLKKDIEKKELNNNNKESGPVVVAVKGLPQKKEPEPEPDRKVAITFQLYQQQIGVINPRLAELVREDIEDIPLEWIPLAFDRAAAANANKWAYVKGTLQNWKAQGGPQDRKNGSANAPPVDPSLYRHEDWVKLQAAPGETVEQTFDRLKKQQRIPSNAILRRSNHNGRISSNQ